MTSFVCVSYFHQMENSGLTNPAECFKKLKAARILTLFNGKR